MEPRHGDSNTASSLIPAKELQLIPSEEIRERLLSDGKAVILVKESNSISIVMIGGGEIELPPGYSAIQVGREVIDEILRGHRVFRRYNKDCSFTDDPRAKTGCLLHIKDVAKYLGRGSLFIVNPPGPLTIKRLASPMLLPDKKDPLYLFRKKYFNGKIDKRVYWRLHDHAMFSKDLEADKFESGHIYARYHRGSNTYIYFCKARLCYLCLGMEGRHYLSLGRRRELLSDFVKFEGQPNNSQASIKGYYRVSGSPYHMKKEHELLEGLNGDFDSTDTYSAADIHFLELGDISELTPMVKYRLQMDGVVFTEGLFNYITHEVIVVDLKGEVLRPTTNRYLCHTLKSALISMVNGYFGLHHKDITSAKFVLGDKFIPIPLPAGCQRSDLEN